MEIFRGDALDLLKNFDDRVGGKKIDLVVTDPPYAFGGSGDEHAIVATVAVALRECARRMNRGSWMVVFAASSWRSMSYMVESVRGILEPVRVGSWCKPSSRTKVATKGWKWATVSAICLRKGKSRDLPPVPDLDHVEAEVIRNGRRAQLPDVVAEWAVLPFAVEGGLFLDPFAGSGALVKAAEKFKMDAYGFEKGES